MPYPLAKPSHTGINPVHRILAQHKGGLEHEKKYQEKDGEAYIFIGKHIIDEMRHTVCVFLVAFLKSGFTESTVNETVLGIHHSRFRVFVSVALYLLLRCVDGSFYFGSMLKSIHHTIHFTVVFQQFDGQIAGRVAVANLLVMLKHSFYQIYAGFHVLSVIDVDVTVIVLHRPVARGKVFQMAVLYRLCRTSLARVLATMRTGRHRRFLLFSIGVVPLAYLAGHLGIDAPFCIHVVDTFVHINYNMEQQIHASARLKRRGHHGHAEQCAQTIDVKMVATLFKLIIHIKGTHHALVHVDKLCGQIQITLQIMGVNDIDDNVGGAVNNIAPYIEFFRTVSRKRIRAWQVNKVEIVAFKVGMSLTGVHRHPAVVTHTGMGTAGIVE